MANGHIIVRVYKCIMSMSHVTIIVINCFFVNNNSDSNNIIL